MTAHLPGRIVAPWQESIPVTPDPGRPAIATVVMGTLTAAYGLLELLNPAILAKQTEMAGTHPVIADRLTKVSRVLGIRDIVSGTALAIARTPAQRRVATAVRVACDLTDGIALTATLPPPAPKAKILSITGGWAVLSLVAGIIAERTGR